MGTASVAPNRLTVLLRVLQDASVAEVVDVAAQVHQLWVDTIGHEAVGRDGAVRGAGHHRGAFGHALRAPLDQGTKSATSHVII